jgi:hypothetical protein
MAITKAAVTANDESARSISLGFESSEDAAMTMITNLVMALMGLIAIWFAFFATGIRGAFSGGPELPVSRVGRVALFILGVVVLGTAIRRLVQ